MDTIRARIEGFYSTLVRLKETWLPPEERQTETFLFHTGSIKSIIELMGLLEPREVSIPHWFD